MKKKIKQPNDLLGKRIRTHSGLSDKPAETKKPIFSFQHLNSEYCISCCNKNEKASLADTLRKLSTLTWAQIHQAPKHGLGCEKIERKAITKPVPLFIKPDAAILAFRFSGKAPMVGYRENEVFHIIWLDRDFTLYNHG